MVLSETRGLSLFLVVRGGIGFLDRLSAEAHAYLTHNFKLDDDRIKTLGTGKALTPRTNGNIGGYGQT
jgi:hypothetical protein